MPHTRWKVWPRTHTVRKKVHPDIRGFLINSTLAFVRQLCVCVVCMLPERRGWARICSGLELNTLHAYLLSVVVIVCLDDLRFSRRTTSFAIHDFMFEWRNTFSLKTRYSKSSFYRFPTWLVSGMFAETSTLVTWNSESRTWPTCLPVGNTATALWMMWSCIQVCVSEKRKSRTGKWNGVRPSRRTSLSSVSRCIGRCLYRAIPTHRECHTQSNTHDK